MSVASRIIQLPPFPKSWYMVEESSKLKAGAILALEFCGQQVVLYRTASGLAVLAEAFCPHMGAHFAHGGKIDGENLQCPFHGFCFSPDGQCVKTGYGTKPPPQARMRTWPIDEVNGMIFAWHDTLGSLPDWRIPTLDWEGWSEIKFADWRITSHPQEIAENSADIGHFRHVHGYGDVKVFQEARTEGPVLFGRYGMSRIASFVGKGGRKINAEFDFFEHGLGLAYVEAQAVEFGLHSRHFVMPMPIDGQEVVLRIAVSVRLDYDPKKIHPLLQLVPKSILNHFITRGYHREYQRDVSDDFKIWTNKAYVHPPALAQGDGPLILYRKWAEQFYA
jgi:phenylpropionate dioxygenase-like ring-hydroxylating dioxygenase large terminal subunit